MATRKKKTKKKKRGPKLTLTKKIIKEASDLARKGNFQQDIASRLQIRVTTWNSWLDRGRKRLKEIEEGKSNDYTLQCELVEELEAASSEARAVLMEDCATSSDDRVKLQFLKLRYGQYFSQQRKAIDGDTGEVTKRSAKDILAEKLANFLDED